jgi:hypothetical protein
LAGETLICGPLSGAPPEAVNWQALAAGGRLTCHMLVPATATGCTLVVESHSKAPGIPISELLI